MLYTRNVFSFYFLFDSVRLLTTKTPAGSFFGSYLVRSKIEKKGGNFQLLLLPLSLSLSGLMPPPISSLLCVSVFRHTGQLSTAVVLALLQEKRNCGCKGGRERREETEHSRGGEEKLRERKKLSERPPVSAQLVRLPWAAHPKISGGCALSMCFSLPSF